jgi:hypothetical protein
MFKIILLIAGLPFFHPEREIACPKYIPGSNVQVPNGVVFQYTPCPVAQQSDEMLL